MLERATKCLQRGGKSAIVLYGKDKHTGRSLQSLFWTHGAGDIDLPPWWSDFLQQPDFQQSRANNGLRTVPHTVRSNFLDFLYPPKTIDYAQSLATRRTRRDRIIRQRLLLLGGRQSRRKGSSQTATAPVTSQQDEDAVSISVQDEAEAASVVQQRKKIKNRESKDKQGNNAVLRNKKRTAFKDAKTAASVDDGLGSIAKSQTIQQLESLEASTAQALAELNAISAKFSEDLDTSTLGQAINEAVSITGQDLASTRSDREANLDFWHRQSEELAEAYSNYLNAVDAANAIPQAQDGFLSTFAYEVPVIKWQFESTIQAGLDFLTLFMKHLYSSVLPTDEKLWSDKQWSFLIRMTFLHPRRGVEKNEPLMFSNIDIPIGTKGVFVLLKKAFAANKAMKPARDLLKLALSRGQIDFIHSLLRFCNLQGMPSLRILAAVDTIDAPSLVRNMLLLVKRIEVVPWLGKRVGLYNEVQPNRMAYLEIIHHLAVRLLRRHHLPKEVNVAAYQEIWMVLVKHKYLKTKHFVLLLNQLLGVNYTDRTELSMFVQFAYKTFFELCQRSDFIWNERHMKKFLQMMMKVHHPQYLKVFDYYRSRFGFDSEVYKDMLLELSYAAEAERWREIYKEIESREELNKFEWLHQLIIAYSRRADITTCRALLESARKEMGRDPDLRSWNAVLHSYVQGNDMAGALDFYQYMEQQGIKVDASTAMILLRGYSSRGETVLALEQAAHIKAEDEELAIQTVQPLIHCHLINGDMDSAEQLLYDANDKDLKDSQTEAWNMVLTSYAHKGKIVDMNYIHGLMHEYGIKENASTYGAVMLGFSMANVPSMAFRIMSKIMPMHNIAPTIEHYNVLIGGLVRRGEYDFALKVYQMAKEEHIKPDAVTRNLVIQAISSAYGGLKKGDIGWFRVRQRAVEKAEEFLQQSLIEDSYEHAASSTKMTGSSGAPLNQAHTSLYFSFLIHQYAHFGDGDQVNRLLKQYHEFHARRYPGQKVVEPPKMLAAIGQHYLKIKDTNGIVNLWNKALETLTPQVKAIGADTSKPGWVLPSRSMLLSPIFRIRMIDLMQRKQYEELEELTKTLITAGWQFPGLVWNLYVRFLAMEGHTELAFKYCEQYLIDGFQGWPRSMKRGNTPKRRLESSTVGSTSSRVAKPTYEVLCWLAKSYINFRRKYAFSVRRADHMARLWEIAPNSLNAVTYMPRVDDDTQGVILRDEKKKEKHSKKHKPFRRP